MVNEFFPDKKNELAAGVRKSRPSTINTNPGIPHCLALPFTSGNALLFFLDQKNKVARGMLYPDQVKTINAINSLR